MAKINNAQIIQKLVDELKLYPGKDLIPSELADKVLAVFQVNTSDKVITSPVKANIVRDVVNVSAGSQTLYTVPATGKFYLTNVSFHCAARNATLNVSNYLQITPAGDSARKILAMQTYNTLDKSEQDVTNSLNLQNPILLEPGSIVGIVIATGVKGDASMVGYTEES